MDWLGAHFTRNLAVPLARRLPLGCLDRLALAVGQGVYCFVLQRRRAALENLRRFYGGEKTERELRDLAWRSSISLALGVIENMRCHRTAQEVQPMNLGRDSEAALRAAKALHEQTGGCIFVSVHIGGYALLPYLFSGAGISLTVPINPLRNRRLQDWWCPLDQERAPGAEVFVAKKNSLAELSRALDVNRSVGLLADQRSGPVHAVNVGMTSVLTSRMPALLAVRHSRPIVAGACYRNASGERFRIALGEPLWPDGKSKDESEIGRLTDRLDRNLAQLVRAAPEQYLWMHNRWKAHRVRARITP